MSATSSWHLSLSAAMLASSVNDRLMVAMFFFTSIHCKGRRPYGLFTSIASWASVKACAAGEFEAALIQWPNHFSLFSCTILVIGTWPVLAYKSSFESCLSRLSSPSSRVCLVVHSSLLYSRTLMTSVVKSLSFRSVDTRLCLKTTVQMVWSAASD